MQRENYLWDDNGIRYNHVKSQPGHDYNWLFVPGGAGLDSNYLFDLANGLDLPGNFWLIDFPFNGTNDRPGETAENYNFDMWFEYVIPLVERFSNPIFVGHSFGGMLPLIVPELEKLLTGLVLLNAAPSLWLDAAAKVAAEIGLPSLDEPTAEFNNNPNPETFRKVLMAGAPYYFPPEKMVSGKELLNTLIANFYATNWWFDRAMSTNYRAAWAPQKLPTVIIHGKEDHILPFSLYEDDKRFNRDNIIAKVIDNAGHVTWHDDMKAVQQGFDSLLMMIEAMHDRKEV